MLKTVPTPTAVKSRQKAYPVELIRWAFLAAVALWLLSPFATGSQVGAGDALWYSNMLADFVLQWRAGVFPVFAGQTEFAFNGAVYPLRVAPLYQHLGGILDLLTAHRLGFFALQHLVVIVCGVGGIFSSYACLTAIAPTQRWIAALLSTLYLSCPGVLGTIFTQDLYMTWVAMPFLPVVLCGIVRTFQKNDWSAQVLLSAGLALLWLAHAPIAMWMTLIAIGTQGYRLLVRDRNLNSWKRSMTGAGLLALLGSYPFISVNFLRAPGTLSAVSDKFEHPERILSAIREVFPAVLRPLSSGAALLSDLQLGYGLWIVLLVSTAALLFNRKTELRLLITAVGAILLLLLPVPLITSWFWLHAPQTVQKLTYYWPMHRLYMVLAAILAATGQLAIAAFYAYYPPAHRALTTILALACAWSLIEAREFIAAGENRTATIEASALRHHSENLLLMTHAYGLFSKLPGYFSDGVMDPEAEIRLLDFQTWKPIHASPRDVTQHGTLVGHIDANPGILDLEPSFKLAPGKRYELTFSFRDLPYLGILQITGASFFREYALPHSGQPLAFGSAGQSSNALSLWTTSDIPEEITLRFIPTGAGVGPKNFLPFAEFTLAELPKDQESVRVDSLLPLCMFVHADTQSWLETPRVFMPGYRAIVNGQNEEIRASPEGLVAIPLKQGESTVQIEFQGPLLLRVAYWVTLCAWLTLLCAIVGRVFTSGQRPRVNA